MDISCALANYDQQANFERDFDMPHSGESSGRSKTYDTVVNCASIDFLLHIITNPKSKKAQRSQ